ncbi:MAG: class I SAM-dependent methyltransferase [Gammaproteobacteria bacterium]|jgi:ubiquinone/menaquinone biosynthesis C-methylase UbiE|nr:SAM-dependent methyltransferase [Gammaproteobacteria bacterium]MDP6096701.1 class I SAM-dependent methyltransferase [Gammaproteobacteria bacterium]HJO11556.1 class I SAM-dependent methyltransferase [Gammaproteobacteria bacterium]|tara:strand:- start:1801 stop:2484 length:684 start_codon:yes stop_codon:yes gene_type:complete
MRPNRTNSLLLLPLLIILPAVSAAQSSLPDIERQTELVDPRDAAWFYRSERSESEKPEELLDLLGIKEGDVVADIGAGVGFFSLRAAERVGPGGKVFAVDVQPEMIEGLEMMMKRFGHENIEPILGNVDDPKLPVDSVDHVLLVISYHEFSHPIEMMRHIHKAMKRDGQMLIVEYRAEDLNSRVSPLHKMSEAEIMEEIPALGFRRDRVIDIIPSQHVFVFRKTELD